MRASLVLRCASATTLGASALRSVTPQLFIGNEFVSSVTGVTIDTIDPSTGQPLLSVAAAEAADVDRAVTCARAAFKMWKRSDGSTRRDALNRLADLLQRDLDEFAVLEALDTGKPLSEARDDMTASVRVLRYYAGWADKIGGHMCPTEGQTLTFTKHHPVGVCGQIIPWNFPLNMLSWKVGPALATGNCVIIKPSEMTPLTALRFAAAVQEADLPPGVVNVLPGLGASAGAALARHPSIDKVAFTGSSAVGRQVQVMAAESNLKRCSLELGGKSPLIVFPDADLDNAITWIETGVLLNQGQVCSASSRILLHDDVYDEVVGRLKTSFEGRKVGPWWAEGVQQGPMISAQQRERVLSYIRQGVEDDGATLVCGGKPVDPARLPEECRGGYFVEPTIFTNVTDRMTIAREEIFGPVASVMRFFSVDEAIERANATSYGLGAGVHTRDLNTAMRVADELESGAVWVNMWDVGDVAAPFGGVKQSGYGRELGAYALDLYTEVKTVMCQVNFTPTRN